MTDTPTLPSPPLTPAAIHPARLTYIRAGRTSDLVYAHLSDVALRGLVGDWEALCRRRSVLRHVNSWCLPGDEIDHLDEVVRRAGYGRPVDDSEADHYLWLLTCLAKTDQLAARIVLQRIVPPLISIARRRGRITPGGFAVTFDEVLAAAWIVIKNFPVERRHHKIASNLTRDVEYQAFVRNARLRQVSAIAVEDDASIAAPEAPDPDPGVELSELLRDAAARGLDPAHVEVLQRIARGGNTEEIGLEQGVSGRTIRMRRRKALDALREMLNVLV